MKSSFEVLGAMSKTLPHIKLEEFKNGGLLENCTKFGPSEWPIRPGLISAFVSVTHFSKFGPFF